MKILFVSTFYYPNMQGGVEQVIKRLAESLAKEKNEVAIFCCDSKNENIEISYYNDVKIYRCSAHDFQLFKFSYDKKNVGKFEKLHQKLLCYYNKKIIEDFCEVCEDFNPDIIHTHTLYGIVPSIWKCAADNKVPIVHTIHDLMPVSPTQYGHKTNFIVKIFHKVYMTFYSRYVNAVTAPSNYTLLSSLKAGCFKNASIKKRVVNAIEISKDELEKLIMEKKERSIQTIKFVFAGRLIYFKGIKHMIEAFSGLDIDAELHICGSGEMSDYVKKMALKDKRIHYHGKLDNDGLYKVYDECDVMLVPSEWPEPFGMVVIEGNVHGLPVIASECGGIPEIFEVVHGGVLYKSGDTKVLRAYLKKFTYRQEYNLYYQNIIDNIEYFRLDYQIEQLKDIYSKIVKE